MPNPSRNIMLIRKFSSDRTKAQQAARNKQAAPPPRTTPPSQKSSVRVSTHMGDKLKAAIQAKKVAAVDDIQKRGGVIVAIR
jgi:hypothetical protein